MSNTVHVKDISSQTSEKEIKDFFSFCGKISSISVTPTSDAGGSTQSATVTFDKSTAAKTALLLDNTQLGPAQVHVTSASSLEELSKSAAAENETADELSQEDKPRSRIVAEYLAQGYVISDKAIERAIALDSQHGISSRFTQTLSDFDDKLKATERAQAVDQQYRVSERANAGWQGLNSYFEKALGTPTGQRVRQFYSVGNKQVMDVHNEARHLADLKSGKGGMSNVEGTNRTKCNCGANTGKCPCAPGTCACASCAKNPDEKTSTVNAETAQMEQIPGTNKTKCNCGSDTGKCPCEPGKCGCSSCPKNAET